MNKINNTHLARPSREWLAYDAANPHLRINDISDPNPGLSPSALREAANSAKIATVRRQLAQAGLDRKVVRTDCAAVSRDGQDIPLRIYRRRREWPSGSGESNINKTGIHEKKYNNYFLEKEEYFSSSEEEEDAAPPPPLAAAFVYFHGGGMLIGNLDTDDLNCSIWSDLLGSDNDNDDDVVIISVNYRHTPEHVFPAQQHDAWDAFLWTSNNAARLGIDRDRIVVGGISSGASLAAEVALLCANKRRDHDDNSTSAPMVKGQILAMPWLVHRDAYPLGEYEESSLTQCRDAPIMPAAKYNLFTDLLGEEAKRGFSAGLVAPETLEGMPPTAVVACGWDMLRDEAIAFADRLESAGSRLKKHVFPGLPHAFTKYQDLPSSRRFNELMVESIRWCLVGGEADQPGRWVYEMAGYQKPPPPKRACWGWFPSSLFPRTILGRGT